VSTSAAGMAAVHSSQRASTAARLHTYFADTPGRTLQTTLGLIWLLDGGLQFQSFMYSRGFVALLRSGAAGQPSWVHDSVIWAAKLASQHLTVWNTLFALVQVLIGIGLLYRPAVKPALVLTCAWAVVVWWFGEAFGMMLMSGTAAPLNGAPGGVIIYLLVGLIAWPSQTPGGLLGVRGARTMWAALWLVMAWLWLQSASASPDALRDMINAAPSGMSWLSSLQDGFAFVARGNGVAISLVLSAVSGAIALGVAANWRARQFLALAVILNVVYWLVGQGLGGIFAGGATDPGTAPLIILLAYGLYGLVPYELEPSRKEMVMTP
jgi:hypothetical protein